MVAFTAIVRFLLATTETMAAPAMLRVVITKMKGRFFMGTLLSSQSIFRLQLSAVYQRCNSGHRDDDFIEFDTLAVELCPRKRTLSYSS